MRKTNLILSTLLLSVLSKAVVASEFNELSIQQLQQGVREGKFSYTEVTNYYLTQIEKLNPKLNAVIKINPHALADANAKDKAWQQGNKQGILFGVPILLKDNIDTKFMPTTAGALALANNLPATNAEIVDNLIAQGAIILGKANLSEWANFKSMKSSSGFSTLGGQTRNPFNLAYTPCGSSSGSAVAVAANMSLVSIGTETDGSIHCPAAMSSVVGFKPSISHISQKGIIPIAHSQDTAGPMARTVADAALVYYALAGVKKKQNLKKLAQVRMGLIPELYGFNQANQDQFEQLVNKLKSAGVTVVDELKFVNLEQMFNAEFDILLHEFHQGLNQYLQATPDAVKVKNLAQLVEFNKARGDNQQDLLLSSLYGPDVERYKNAKEKVETVAKQQFSALFEQHQLDVIIAPTVGAAWKIDPEYGDQFSGSSTSLAAVTGYPSIAIPVGQVKGMPVSISIIARAENDILLLSIAQEIEAIVGKRLEPNLSFARSTLVNK